MAPDKTNSKKHPPSTELPIWLRWTLGIIGGLAVVTGAVFSVLTYYHNIFASDLAYLKDAQQSQPMIRLVGRPDLVSIAFVIKEPTLRELSRRMKAKLPADSLGIAGTFRLQFNLKLTNLSSYTAHGRLEVVSDTTSMLPILRRRLFGHRVHLDSASTTLRILNVGLGDTVGFSFDWEIQNVVEGKFILHFLFQYSNPAGFLFDYYYWAAYNGIIPSYGIGLRKTNKGEEIVWVSRVVTPDSVLTLLDSNEDSHIYSRKEADEMNELYERSVLAYFEKVKK
jgi:hypothetical protein